MGRQKTLAENSTPTPADGTTRSIFSNLASSGGTEKIPGFERRLHLKRDLEYIPAAGYGESYGHHGEILQGAVASPRGTPKPVLVTLPCLRYRVTARFFPRPGRPLEVRPQARPKAARAVRLTLSSLDLPGMGGVLVLNGNIPFRQGLGSSTADVTAAIRAVADAFGRTLAPDRIARLAVKAEIASDALMFGEAALVFAQREGVVVERFDKPLPPMEILGLRDPANGPGVDTLSAAPRRYDCRDMARFEALLERLRDGIARGDAETVGSVATISAYLNQRFVGKPRLEDLEAIGRQHGAVGIQVAHSGTAMGLLFRPGHLEAVREAKRELAGQYRNVDAYHIPAALTAIAPCAESEARFVSA
jgi:uncharacterized protein involved in propanediol utilization